MDVLVLTRLVEELDACLRGRRIEQVYALPKNDVVLLCGRRSAPRLWFSAEPADPHLYLRPGGHPTPRRPPGFAMAARRLLVGRRIEALSQPPGERIVELKIGGEAALRLIFEIIPRRATALVVDDGVVRAAWQPRRGRPGLGDPYRPPEADRRTPVSDLPPAAWDKLAAAPDDDALARDLVRRLAGLSPLIAREVVSRRRQAAPLAESVATELERIAEQPAAPRIYAPAPLDELAGLEAVPTARSFLLAPFALQHLEERRPAMHVERFETLIEAAGVYYPLRARLAALAAARDGLGAALRAARGRTERALDAVADDVKGAGDAEQLRRRADLLLASPEGERRGALAMVPDVFGDGTPLEIPIEPSLSLIDNAQRYYQRARRAERSAARTAARRAELEKRLGELQSLAERVSAADAVAECERLARRAAPHGVEVTTTSWLRPEAAVGAADVAADEVAAPKGKDAGDARRRRPGKGSEAGIDVFTSSDGFQILVGRNAAANERLTHKLARPHDFWLHAEGPGSHVLLRNPERAAQPPDAGLREAASLAAHYSRAKHATKVNVRWTEARHVRKPRGAPRGQVSLGQSKTVLAAPRSPRELFTRSD